MIQPNQLSPTIQNTSFQYDGYLSICRIECAGEITHPDTVHFAGGDIPLSETKLFAAIRNAHLGLPSGGVQVDIGHVPEAIIAAASACALRIATDLCPRFSVDTASKANALHVRRQITGQQGSNPVE